MAKMLQAFRVYGPQVELNATAQIKEVAEWMAMRTGLNTSEVIMVLQEMNEVILFFNRQGTPVKLPGVGTFTPSINRGGEYRINLRTDSALKKDLNAPDAYRGPVLNKSNIGLDDAGYKALWDADNPDDPLEV